jgi:hypothetical protein
VCGHSLGGAISELCAILTGCKAYLVNAPSFNPGLSFSRLKEYGKGQKCVLFLNYILIFPRN